MGEARTREIIPGKPRKGWPEDPGTKKKKKERGDPGEYLVWKRQVESQYRKRTLCARLDLMAGTFKTDIKVERNLVRGGG